MKRTYKFWCEVTHLCDGDEVEIEFDGTETEEEIEEIVEQEFNIWYGNNVTSGWGEKEE